MKSLIIYYLADAASSFEWIAPILQFGVGGGVLVWFMLSVTPRLKGIEAAIDRLARSILLLIVSLPNATDVGKKQAEVIKGEVDDAERDRTK